MCASEQVADRFSGKELGVIGHIGCTSAVIVLSPPSSMVCVWNVLLKACVLKPWSLARLFKVESSGRN